MINWYKFFMAGNATITIKNTKTGRHFTYNVKQSRWKDTWWVVLKQHQGPDLYIGSLTSKRFNITPKSVLGKNDVRWRGFNWVWWHLVYKRPLPEYVEIRHCNTCGRCGRELTRPDSIDRGYGPMCAELLGLSEFAIPH